MDAFNRSLRSSLLLSLALCLGGHQPFRRQLPVEAIGWARSDLVVVLGPARLICGRLAGFGFARKETVARLDPRALGALARKLEQSRSARALASLAVLHLASARSIEGAISELERAHGKAPTDAAIASDLSALYLERGLREHDPREFVLALSFAREAVRLNSKLPEARFNAALALGKLFLVADAKQAWASYLALDSQSGWATEASALLAQLKGPPPEELWEQKRVQLQAAVAAGDTSRVRTTVDANRQQARLFGELELLADWAEAAHHGESRTAESALTTAREIGKAYLAISHDGLLNDSVAAIDEAVKEGQEARLFALIAGHRSYRQAHRYYQLYQSRRAAATFDTARRFLYQGRSPLWRWAAFFGCASRFHLASYREAENGLRQLGADQRVVRYPSLAGRVDWLQGLLRAVNADPVGARASYMAALNCFHLTGERENQAAVHHLLFELSDFLGDSTDAWSHIYQALTDLPHVVDLRYRQSIFHGAAEAVARDGMPEIALYFENEALRAARQSGNAVQVAVVLWERALLDHRADLWSSALQDIREARRLAIAAADDALEADVLLAEGQILQERDRAAALRALSQALPLLKKTHYRLKLASLYLERGQLLSTTDRSAALKEFATGIGEVEHVRASLDTQMRTPFFDQYLLLFQEMISLLVDQRRSQEAFEYAELSRSRVLAERLGSINPSGGDATRVATLRELERVMPPGAAMIEIALLDRRSVAWTVTNSRSVLVELPVTPQALSAAVSRYLDLVGSADREAELSEVASYLYRKVLQPVRGLLASSKLLIFVPDRDLHRLPFGALLDTARGRYLVEDHPILVVPSATLFLRGLSRARKRGSPSPRFLMIANPALGREVAPNMADLPSALEEAKVVSSFYRSAEVLTGRNATKQRFLSALSDHEVVQFSGHTQFSARSPLFSRLLLAPSGGDTGVLFAHEIYRKRFQPTRLLILASCGSAAGSSPTSEGVSSLARAFLAAGVGAVVGSLWDVRDEAAAAFSVRFHRHLAATGNELRAMQLAQLDLLRSSEPVLRSASAWAAFELIGVGGYGIDLKGD